MASRISPGHPKKNPLSKNQGAGKRTSTLRPPGSPAAPKSRPADVTPPPGPRRSAGTPKNTGKKSRAEILITGGILTAATAMAVSLLAYFHPVSPEDIRSAVQGFCSYVSNRLDPPESSADSQQPDDAQTDPAGDNSRSDSSVDTKEISQMARTDELGEISDMYGEPVFPPQDTIYSCMLDTAMGPLLYYNQGDIRWKEYLYGGQDRIAKYGCGPVCVAMVINSFSSRSVTPVEMADWSADNGFYARQSGSYHSLIPQSISAFGLQVDSVTERTPEEAARLLDTGHILVALMGKGSLTQGGHFIIIAQLASEGHVYIADPASYENSTKEWDLQLLMDELKRSYDSGGPLWAVCYPPTRETENSEEN